MANKSTTFGRIARRSPEIAKLRLCNALRKTKGNVAGAARTLGMGERQVRRYLVRFNLSSALERERTATGWHRPAVREGKRLDRWRKARKRKATPESKRLDSLPGK